MTIIGILRKRNPRELKLDVHYLLFHISSSICSRRSHFHIKSHTWLTPAALASETNHNFYGIWKNDFDKKLYKVVNDDQIVHPFIKLIMAAEADTACHKQYDEKGKKLVNGFWQFMHAGLHN